MMGKYTAPPNFSKFFSTQAALFTASGAVSVFRRFLERQPPKTGSFNDFGDRRVQFRDFLDTAPEYQ